jgi:hypothetical protein
MTNSLADPRLFKMKTYHLTAFWDDDTKVWTTETSGIPGLVVEAESVEELLSLIQELAPELVADNLPDSDGPFELQVKVPGEFGCTFHLNATAIPSAT